MQFFKKIIFLLGFVILFPIAAMAANYSLVSGAACGSGSTCPACASGGTWSVSGANFTCSTSISLASGDTIAISTSGSITANASISLNNNTIGSASKTINLISTSNTINTTGNWSLFGSITTNSSTLSLSGGSVTGSVSSSCCSITTNGTVIGGAITTTTGSISITGGSVGGAVTTGCCTITANSTILSGSLSANGNITLTSSTLGTSVSPVSVTTSTGAITLNSSTTAYGTLTAPSYSTVNVNSGSTVSGSCIPNSTPANACNASAVLLGSWRMDETSWNGALGEVKDTSGQGNHGRARIANGSTLLPTTTSGSPAFTSGAQSTCRYGTFDSVSAPIRTYNYVELSGFPALPNGFTFAAWIRSTNASAQHQRILVRDDADNGWGLSLADGTGTPKLRFFARQVTNNGAVTGQGTNPNCGVFCVDTNSVLTSNAWYYVASVINTAAKTVTLYVYNASGVLQAKATGAYSGTWTDGTGTAAIGGETSASSEGTQTSWHFLGNIDEVNIYSGALSQTSIESLLTTVRTCPAPDHYELDVPATNISCIGADVSVRACADNASPCTNIDYTVNSNVNLATSAGALNSSTLTLAGSGATKLFYPAASDGATATVTLSGEVTAAINARKCCLGGSCSVANSCTTTFRTAGFVFSNTASGATGNIPTQIAGVTGNSVYVRALQTNTTTGACTARFTSPQTVPLAYQCRNPTSCITGQTLSLNGVAVQSNANTASPISYTNVDLTFDANGSAPIPINYSDVGQIKLWANLALAATSTNPAITLSGSSNDFVVKPYSLKISSVATTSGGANPGGTSASGTAAGFVAAGTPFQVKIQAINGASTPALTPNFGNEIPVNSKTEKDYLNVQINSLVYPSSGNSTAITGAGDSSFSATTPAGTFVNNAVVWNQVGSLTLKPLLSDADYLGAGDVNVTASATVGRFYPDHYRLVSSQVTDTCALGASTFSYMSEPKITLKYKLQAETLGGNVATNYGGNYAVGTIATPNYVAENLNGANGGSLSSRLNAGAVAAVWSGGILDFSSTAASFSREITKEIPDGPYISLQLGINLVDSFDLRSLQSLDMNSITAAGSCSPTCTEKSLGAPLNLVYGRLKIDDSFGPETVSLPVNFVTEYWTGNNFSRNGLDSCTIIPRASIIYPAGNLTNDANRTVPVGGGSTQAMYTNLDAAGVHFGAGTAGQYFTAPGAGNTTSSAFLLQIDLTNFPWLRYDWNQDGTYSDIQLPNAIKVPNAKIGFGSYRGNDRIIYWREKLQ